jgi:hypothetical protein
MPHCRRSVAMIERSHAPDGQCRRLREQSKTKSPKKTLSVSIGKAEQRFRHAVEEHGSTESAGGASDDLSLPLGDYVVVAAGSHEVLDVELFVAQQFGR